MLSTEQKINEIYELLRKNESRRKRHLLISIIWKVLIGWFILLVILYPEFVFRSIYTVMSPIIEQAVQNVLETQKENFMNTLGTAGQSTYEKALNTFDGIRK